MYRVLFLQRDIITLTDCGKIKSETSMSGMLLRKMAQLGLHGV
jgi:hypothetical protein